MGGALAAHVAAINEFREFLGEESLSKLFVDECTVEFSLQTSGKPHILYQVEDDAYPRTPALFLCTSQDTLSLDKINAKLAEGGYSIAKALSLLGRQLDVDLDWTLEALEEANANDGGSDGGGGENSLGAGSEDDDKMSEDEEMYGQDVDILREWSRKVIQLEAIEKEITKTANENTSTSAAAVVAVEHSEKQIFDTKAAFRRLLNELEEIFKAQEMNLMADAPGLNGLFQWEVYLAGFKNSGEKNNLHADLHQTGRRFGLSSVHLQIEFKRGLHPFYPPSVRILSPRFIGPILGAIANFPTLHPKSWDPVNSAKDIILQIKELLEIHGRVDLESSTQTYHPAEILITRLSALTGIQPIDPATSPEYAYSFNSQQMENNWGGYSFKYNNGSGTGEKQQQKQTGLVVKPESTSSKDPFEMNSSPASKKLRVVFGSEPAKTTAGTSTSPALLEEATQQQKPDSDTEYGAEEEPEEVMNAEEPNEKSIAWNKGVGYGVGRNAKDHKVWDARRAEALQDARDAELYHVLTALALAVKNSFTDDESFCDVDHVGEENGMQLCDGEKEKENKDDENEKTEEKERVLAVLKTGCLVPFLIKELRSTGFQGMVSRAAYYRALLECAQVLCLHPETVPLLCWHADNDLKSIATAVANLKAQASTFLRVLGDQATGSTLEDDSTLATLLLNVADEISARTKSSLPNATGQNNGQQFQTSKTNARDTIMTPATHSNPKDESDAHYVSTMSPFKVALVPGIAANHAYKELASKEPTAASRQRARRVASELASLESDLPVNASSSVFVCADEQQTILWKALITGPTGTPYESGCFVFDIYFPSDYPDRPPHVKLRTTGGGKVRFNPNLYNCGKVCLSLLGTWSGEKGESWSKEYSSILQVLISIQSLIFVDQPFYNEPGFESRPNDDTSNAYSADIMAHTVRWAMLDQLISPPAYFADAIKSHYRERGETVLATVRRWEQWCMEIGAKNSAAGIKKMLPDLEKEILKLRKNAAA